MNAKPYILSVILSGVLLGGTPANAIIMVQECVWYGEYDAATDSLPHRYGANSWPNGFTLDYVEYGPNDVEWQAELGAEITECRTGRILVIEIEEDAPPYENTLRMGDFLMAEAQSDNTLDQVRTLALNAGFGATMFTDNEERCGCATFYPELRGDKTPFDADKYYGATE